ncbi:hypothetical protein VNI00_010462 [Paramarasmius palmivorus]|uniref:ABC transporter domain-containing protein n=1 Tax=Paramarasmius palmivorus TaxID=297713 RepID=A0AAW0CKS7_9AGAR
MANSFTSTMFWWILRWNAVETESNSMERIARYLEIDQERKPIKEGVPPAYWPSSGDLRVEDLSAKYSADGPTVLHSLSFDAKAGERLGIVGRTGSGKSTLTLSLLQCIPTEGEVFYDNIPISTLNLDALRSKITIIPQSPDLVGGTLRQNLDPFGEHDDQTLNSALLSAGLQSIQQNLRSDDRINLDTVVVSGGSNFSVGQRQIIALARAIVRRSKLLILDEATSAIDHETDSIIQSSLRNELGSDVTVIIVAHRLQTVMDVDRLMVLEAGRMVEFDTPRNLLQKPAGYFRDLVDNSHDRTALLSAMG